MKSIKLKPDDNTKKMEKEAKLTSTPEVKKKIKKFKVKKNTLNTNDILYSKHSDKANKTNSFVSRKTRERTKRYRMMQSDDRPFKDDYKETHSEPFYVIKNKFDLTNQRNQNYDTEKYETINCYKDEDIRNDIAERAFQKQLKQKRIQKRKANSLPTKHPDLEERTIFVGNISSDSKRRKVKSFFTKYGQVETVRFRGITPEDSSISKKEAIVMKKIDPAKKTIIAFVRFKDVVSKNKALAANGELFGGLHLRVDSAVQGSHKDNHSIFVGNIPWEATEEDLRSFFKGCGTINDIHVVRSSATGAAKGIAFVSFESKDAAEMALHFHGKMLLKRALRIKRIIQKEKDEQTVSKKSKFLSPPSKKTKLDKMKRDKSTLRKQGIRRNFGKKNRTRNVTEDFSGTRAVEDGKAMKKKKKPRWTKTEMKKFAIAKQLAKA